MLEFDQKNIHNLTGEHSNGFRDKMGSFFNHTYILSLKSVILSQKNTNKKYHRKRNVKMIDLCSPKTELKNDTFTPSHQVRYNCFLEKYF